MRFLASLSLLSVACASSQNWTPTQRDIDDMTYDEVAWWLETNLGPLTAVVEVESTRGLRDVVIRECELEYRRSTDTREPITVYLRDVHLVRTRSVQLDAAAIEIRWVWEEGRDPLYLQSRFAGEAQTSIGFRRPQTAKEDAEVVAAAIDHIVELCESY